MTKTNTAKLTKAQTAALTWYATEGREGKLPTRGKWETLCALEDRGLVAVRWETEGVCRTGVRVITDAGRAALGL